MLTLAFGAAFLVHPEIGLFTLTAAAAATLLAPARLSRSLVPAMGGGAIMAVPQLATMMGLSAAAWVGFLFLASGIAVAFWLHEVCDLVADRAAMSSAIANARRRIPPNTGVVLLIAAIVVLLFIAHATLPASDDPMQEIPHDFPRLTILCLAGALLSAGRLGRGWLVLGCGVAAALLAIAASGFVGSRTLTEQAVHYEVPKAVQYWLPVMLALGGAGAVSAFLRLRMPSGLSGATVGRFRAFMATQRAPAGYADLLLHLAGMLRFVAIGAGVVLILYPTTMPLATNVEIGEHRGAESVGLALREAERGYWDFYPDARLIIDAPRQQVVDELRVEEAAGRLGPSTRVLNIANSFQQWASVPIGVFTGALETSISSQPEVSIHTDGGRLLGFDSLQSQLASGYGYVVLEPAGLSQDHLSQALDQIAAAGYRQIWTNSQATIYVPK